MPSEIQKCSLSWQTIQDVHLTISSFVDLIKYTNSEEFKEKYPSATYIIPKRLGFRFKGVVVGMGESLQCCSMATTLQNCYL